MVRAVVVARPAARDRASARGPPSASASARIGVELALAAADHGHVARRAGERERVHVEPADGLRQREDRVGAVVFASRAGPIPRRSPPGTPGVRAAAPGLRVRFGERDQRGGAGGVVDRAVADVVARGVRRCSGRDGPSARCAARIRRAARCPGSMPITFFEANRRMALSNPVEAVTPSGTGAEARLLAAAATAAPGPCPPRASDLPRRPASAPSR